MCRKTLANRVFILPSPQKYSVRSTALDAAIPKTGIPRSRIDWRSEPGTQSSPGSLKGTEEQKKFGEHALNSIRVVCIQAR